MRALVHLLLSVVLAFALIVILAALCDAVGWVYFSGWGMAHGGLVVAFPVCWLLAFVGLLSLPWFKGAWSEKPQAGVVASSTTHPKN